MYGAVQGPSSSKTTNAVALCSCAALCAVAGFVAAQPGYLYAPSTVRPAVQSSVATAPINSAVRPSFAITAQREPAAWSTERSGLPQFGATFVPIALGVGALTALITTILFKSKQAIALAATAGQSTRGQSTRGGSTRGQRSTRGNAPAEERLVWFPSATPPDHLTGEFPGDRGFDPLGLSKDPVVFERMRISEVFHGRLAMLGIVGCIVPELFFSQGPWFDLSGFNLTRLGLVALQVIAPLEYWRGNRGFSWDGDDGPDQSYPGFDPLRLTDEETKLKEIKNGRLAMTAMLGLEVQSHITGKSPLVNLSEHLSNPASVNILTGGGSVAMFAASGRKSQKSDDRPLWFPNTLAPSWLTGEYYGDRGFDPAGLAADPDTFERMRIAEVYHGRLAMLAVVGALLPDYLGKGIWYEAAQNAGIGVKEVAIFTAAYGVFEVARGVKENSDPTTIYPGFDPLNLTTDYTKEAEIKNGRLALTALLGFEVQRHVVGGSPLANLADHLQQPLQRNIADSIMHQWPVAMFASSGHKDGLWFPDAEPPAHLTGEYPADRGFDPLNLAADPDVYARMRVSEVFHGRLAMLCMVGCIVPELLGKGAWFEAGDSVDGLKLGFITMAIAAPTEYWRGQGGFNWAKGDLDRSYPGFDPLNLTTDYTKAAEVKNGRLALTAVAGLTAQYLATGESPLANLSAHLANPIGANIATNLAMFASSGVKEERELWFPNIVPPRYLTGEAFGDRGFDPAGLAADPVTFERMQVSEVFHCRLSMLALVGCLVPELLGNGAWFQIWDKVDFNRFAVVALQVVAPLEYWRGNGGFLWNDEETIDQSYPGFDPLNLTTEYTKEAEIKNGRLAMIGMFGLEVQSHVTGKSPITNLIDHLSHPLTANIGTNLSQPWPPVAMFASSGHKDGLWFPNAEPPAHLTGEYPADRGFDPLNLAADPDVYARMRVAEVFHGRLAMLCMVGCIVPELLGKGAWFEAGDSVDGLKLGFITMAIAAPTEYWRGQGGFNWQKGDLDRSYPGFDPLNLTTDYTRAAEVKNGRLALTAVAGLTAQYLATGESPLANLAAHLANPLGANIATNLA